MQKPKRKVKISELRDILSQPFTYLDECSRTKVYKSADGKYVLKLLKSPSEIQRQFKNWGIDLATVDWSFKKGDPLGTAQIMYRRSIASSILAYRQLRGKTGLIYVHPSKTNQLKIKTNVNGKVISLDTVPFIL